MKKTILTSLLIVIMLGINNNSMGAQGAGIPIPEDVFEHIRVLVSMASETTVTFDLSTCNFDKLLFASSGSASSYLTIRVISLNQILITPDRRAWELAGSPREATAHIILAKELGGSNRTVYLDLRMIMPL